MSSSSSRYSRQPSPPGGRRFADPARSSTGALYNSYDPPPSSYSRHRDSVTSPRASNERVIPVSTERYINGERVSASSLSSGSTARPAYDAYESRPRRTTHDSDRVPPSPSSPAHSRSAVVHQQEPGHRSRNHVNTSSASSSYDSGAYVSSSSSASTLPRREHKKVYSVDDENNLRLHSEHPRHHHSGSTHSGSTHGRSTDYHLSGPRRPQTLDEPDAYEYTDARGMYRDTAPKQRHRQHSFDGPRQRPTSLIDQYPAQPRSSARELYPPPSTRGFEKINASTSGVSRHGSLTGAGRASPPRRSHLRHESGADYYSDQDENYRVAPRFTPHDRRSNNYDAVPDRRDYVPHSSDDRREPRSRGRWEDAQVATRGFGIRAPSTEPPRDVRRSTSISPDSRPEPRLALPAPPARDYDHPEPPRPADREPARPKRDSPPREHHERDEPRREREPPRPRDYEHERDDRRRDERRGEDRRYEDDRRPVERRPERGPERGPERDQDDGRRAQHDDDDEESHTGVGAGIAGAALAGATAYGAKEFHDRHHKDERDGERNSDRESRQPPRPPKEAAQPEERRMTEPGRFVDESPEDMDRPRRRNYARDTEEGEQSSDVRSKHSETLDPEEDYRRRVAQENERAYSEDHASRPPPPQQGESPEGAGMALAPYRSQSDDASIGSGEEGDFQEKRRRRVSIVEPPRAIVAPKGILRKPTEKFPEDPNPIREGVAPLKDAKKDAPPTARWTKINRTMVNPQALTEGKERFEERENHVIVLRVLTREEIQKYADRTAELRGMFSCVLIFVDVKTDTVWQNDDTMRKTAEQDDDTTTTTTDTATMTAKNARRSRKGWKTC